MRRFFNLLHGSLHSDELFEYLSNMIETYDLDTQEIAMAIEYMPDDIIKAVLDIYCWDKYEWLYDAGISIDEYICYGGIDNQVEFDLKDLNDSEDFSKFSEKQMIDVDNAVTDIASKIGEINTILNKFG